MKEPICSGFFSRCVDVCVCLCVQLCRPIFRLPYQVQQSSIKSVTFDLAVHSSSKSNIPFDPLVATVHVGRLVHAAAADSL